MRRKELDNILRNLLVACNIVTVSFEQMKNIRKELNRFVKPVQIEIIKSDFETVSFRELRQWKKYIATISIDTLLGICQHIILWHPGSNTAAG